MYEKNIIHMKFYTTTLREKEGNFFYFVQNRLQLFFLFDVKTFNSFSLLGDQTDTGRTSGSAGRILSHATKRTRPDPTRSIWGLGPPQRRSFLPDDPRTRTYLFLQPPVKLRRPLIEVTFKDLTEEGENSAKVDGSFKKIRSVCFFTASHFYDVKSVRFTNAQMLQTRGG